jgi:hypothetical protein
MGFLGGFSRAFRGLSRNVFFVGAFIEPIPGSRHCEQLAFVMLRESGKYQANYEATQITISIVIARKKNAIWVAS